MESNGDSRNRSRILYVKKILEEKTNETGRESISISEIIKELDNYGIHAVARTIIKDIYYLNQFLDPGKKNRRVEIESIDDDYQRNNEYEYPSIDKIARGKSTKYYFRNRQFNFTEIKLIVDAIRSAKFISEEDSRNLLDKIYTLTNAENIKKLKTQTTRVDRVVTTNEEIMDIVDNIYNAMSNDMQLKFQYMQWTHNRKLEVRKKGAYYQISPWAITWNDGLYYMIGYDDKSEEIRQYRVDKMADVSILDESKREGKKAFQSFNISESAKTTFNMYAGEKKKIHMRFHNSLIGVVFDRFGLEGTANIPDGKDHFLTARNIAVSPQFFGWLAGLGDKAAIVSPEDVAKEYADFLKQIYLSQEKILKKV